MRTDLLDLHRGDAPLLISIPHNGTRVPASIASRLTDEARRVPDTDWHVADLYAFARELGASLLVPTHSRYVVDLNRSEDDVSLYPGRNTTGLCPVVRFDGGPVYRDGEAPDAAEIAARVDTYWRPYHAALADELARLRAAHGRVVLWEAHSIRGTLPFLFEGRLPDLNLGTAGGASCSAALQEALGRVLAAQSGYDTIVNGRFKGGHITRHYGRPASGVDAVQLEISQRCYMDETSFAWDAERAAALTPVLRALLDAAIGHARKA
ncbi:N-formylglutamate deformylase [Luteimonas sp BLCC-B24]|uniref:N-formylglutamate deformylase n=1 Tax=Luteimonas sp. BLCC-B24 TaxID=3025317 RepID=UPI00234E2D6A|nr:N-formylglutamate deformylase [Luteimonas sp. BLCC-B24]MDC7805821.1 N-formylglutamate deformylase [Luteimonas sp. BLCC-B24]